VSATVLQLPTPTTSVRTTCATWFDGITSRARPVRVEVCGSELLLWPEAAQSDLVPLRRLRIADAAASDPITAAPRLVYWSDGTTLEVPDPHDFNDALERAGLAPVNRVLRLQNAWLLLAVTLALLVGMLFFAYVRGIPVAARWVAFSLPLSVEQHVGTELLALLDTRDLAPSRLSLDRRRTLERRLAAAAARADPGLAYRLEFRRTRAGAGINAFALPGGTIVLLDGLVERANDDQLLGVLGHELGHIRNKHGMRNVLQTTGVAVIAGLLWGDFSGVASSAPVVLGMLQQTRSFEREADDFAVVVLKANDRPVEPLIRFFEMLAQREKDHGPALPDFLSTHPATPERIERLKQAL
jgi:Zn-dependent protease with chaperone function